ncbi:MAG: MBL fold metallo-hydrolase, partial [Acidimicrobiales bacterium]
MALDRTLRGDLAGADLGDGFHVLPGQGNALVAETDAGLVLVDAGSLPAAPAMVEHLRSVTESPLHAICYSHGHLGYNAAVGVWQAHAAERGEPQPRLIAHENLLRRYARYRETLDLQARMASVQFPSREGASWRRMLPAFEMTDPTETFADALTVVTGSRTVELLWAPSETDDAIAVWYPDDGLLFGGPATPGDAIPNIGTPLRTQRFTIRWAETLDALAALGAETLVTEFGPVVRGADQVCQRLSRTAEALRWLRREVVERMNRGMGEGEVLADLEYPPELFDESWMTPNYGCPDYIARDLFREESGWWDRNPTTLHPA